VHYFLFAARLVFRVSRLVDLPGDALGHGCIENRDIGDATILDEQFRWST
jgi:hypothetical protein